MPVKWFGSPAASGDNPPQPPPSQTRRGPYIRILTSESTGAWAKGSPATWPRPTPGWPPGALASGGPACPAAPSCSRTSPTATRVAFAVYGFGLIGRPEDAGRRLSEIPRRRREDRRLRCDRALWTPGSSANELIPRICSAGTLNDANPIVGAGTTELLPFGTGQQSFTHRSVWFRRVQTDKNDGVAGMRSGRSTAFDASARAADAVPARQERTGRSKPSRSVYQRQEDDRRSARSTTLVARQEQAHEST